MTVAAEALKVIPERIPPSLTALPRWVCWPSLENKQPIQLGGRPASSKDPSTWSTYGDAFNAYERCGYAGVGIVLGDGLAGLDLDDVRDPETGAVEEWAMCFVRALDSYAEVSPSGTGVKVFVRGKWPMDRKDNERGIECYNGLDANGEHGRYFTVTGHRLDGAPAEANERTAKMAEVFGTMFPPQENRREFNGTPDSEIALQALAGLSPARAVGYHDWLSVGMALHSVGDELLAAWDAWSASCSEKYVSGECARKWKTFKGGKITLGSLIWMAKQDGWTPKGSRAASSNRTGKPGTVTSSDTGNAQRLIEDHGRDLRHCHPWATWHVWTGSHWRLDDTGEVVRRAKDTFRQRLAHAAAALAECDDGDKPAKVKAAAWALRSLDAHRLRAALDLARSEPGIPIVPGEMDCDRWSLNVLNCTLDLRTGTRREHRREDLITRVCSVEHDPGATCPTWDRCLQRWQDGNDDMIEYLQRAVGYSLTGDVSEQCLFFLHGDGANGKTTFLMVLLALLGDYGVQAVADLLMLKHGETHPTERADLHGRRFVCTIETEDGRRMAEALTKQLTGGDKIRARRMRQDFWEFVPTFKLWLAANHKPRITGTDMAIWRRIKVIPFTVTIPAEEKDPHMGDKLKAELPGILAWAIRGCQKWQRNGLAEPDEVRAATDRYRAEQDVVGSWIAECCVVGPDYRCKASALMESITAWSKNSGEQAPNKNALAARLEARGYVKYMSNGTWYRGLAVRSDGTEGAEDVSG